MKASEALKIMQLDPKDPDTIRVFKRTLAFLLYLKTDEELDASELKLRKLSNDIIMLEPTIDLNIASEVDSQDLIRKD